MRPYKVLDCWVVVIGEAESKAQDVIVDRVFLVEDDATEYMRNAPIDVRLVKAPMIIHQNDPSQP
jgi:hypothetical protein